MKHLPCASIRTMTYDGQLSGEASGFWQSWLPPRCGKLSIIHWKSQKLTTTLPSPPPPGTTWTTWMPTHNFEENFRVFSFPTPEVQTLIPYLSVLSCGVWVKVLVLSKEHSPLVQWACNNTAAGLFWRINVVHLKLLAQCLAHNESWLSLADIFMPGLWV